MNTDAKKKLQGMRNAGKVAAEALDLAEKIISDFPNNRNLRLIDVEKAVDAFITSKGGTAECKGYQPSPDGPSYPSFATCISVDEVACHGLPSEELFRDGSIVNVDLVVRLDGCLADTSRTFMVGNVSQEDQKLVKFAKEAMYAGMLVIQKGAPFKIVGQAIEFYRKNKSIAGEPVKVLPNYGGHGIGEKMHEAPFVAHVSNSCIYPITPYQYFTVEPIITVGKNTKTYICEDE
jgi:methionyl aminopeptidase